MPEHFLSGVVAKFSRYGITDTLAKIGGLQLMPENARRAVRLELAACAAASLPGDPVRRPMEAEPLRRILNGHELSGSHLVMLEDPLGGWFVESVTYTGGPYLFLPGVTSHAASILDRVIKASTLSRQDYSQPKFQIAARRLTRAALALSNEVLCRAGLTRGVLPAEESRNSDIHVPRDARLGDLAAAVTFGRADLERMLGSWGVGFSDLAPLVVEAGAVTLQECDPYASPLQRHPIVSTGKTIIAAAPSLLPVALRHQVVCLARYHSVLPELADRLTGAACHVAARCLEDLGMREVNYELPEAPPGICIGQSLFSFDRDKVLYLCVITDDLTNYSEAAVFGDWTLDATCLKAHFDSVVQRLAREIAPPSEVMCLVVLNGIGRGGAVCLGGVTNQCGCEVLMLDIAELETISHLEGGNSLVLWRFAKASRRLSESTKVLSFGALDAFGCWRDREYSFYLSDDTSPAVLYLGCDWEGKLYREAMEKVDPHGILSHDGRHIADVVALHGTKDIPIYIERLTRGDRVAVAVEGYCIPIWIVGPTPTSELDMRNYSAMAQLADTLAYWLWQVTPSLKDWFDTAFADQRRLVIAIAADEPLGLDGEASPEGQTQEPFALESSPSGMALRVTFHGSANEMMDHPDNRGEKELMKPLLLALATLADSRHRAELTGERVDRIVEHHAAPPLKKKLIVTSLGSDPVLDSRGLPRRRAVSKSEENDLLDELGAHLRTKLGLRAGPIRADEQTRVLNEGVRYCHEQLASLVASLSPDQLLEWLVAHHEAILHSVAAAKLTLATRQVCFEQQNSLCREWGMEHSDLSLAGIATRFVIEYVVAQPPSGHRPISLSVHDRLVALASHIVHLGFQSDIAHFKLSEVELGILKSGRLGRNFDAYETASRSFGDAFAAAEIASSEDAFRKTARASEPGREDALKELDEATRDEFGYSLSDIRTHWLTAGDVAREMSPGVARLPRVALVERLVSLLDWDERRVSDVIDRFSLTPRPDFFSPSPPYGLEDVRPWRFGRRLSYMRRPFLVVNGPSGSHVILGPRHLCHAGSYLWYLCRTGRLAAEHDKLKRLISGIREDAGERFNDGVADALEALGSLVVKRRVTKIRSLHAKVPPPPGDIDVLAAEPGNRTLWLIECKNLALARTPREMAREQEQLVRGPKSTTEKHLNRAKWAELHLQEILQWLGLGWSVKWRVSPLIVLDHRPMVAYLTQGPVRIVGLAELVSEFQKGEQFERKGR